MKDYYKILGIQRNASEAEIKSAYRKLAHQFHPDRPNGNESKFKEVSEAYQVLSNQEKRRHYDKFGQSFSGAGGGSNPFGQGGAWEFGFENINPEDFANLGDIFENLFDGIGVKRRKTYHRGADLQIDLEITLEEAFNGKEKSISIKSFIPCDQCQGAGHFVKDGVKECATCGGQGEIRETRNSFFGQFAQIHRCSQCYGTGQIPNKSCSQCAASGRVKKDKEVLISITPGIQNSQLIKISGAGEAGERGAATGDLYVRILVNPHSVYRVKDADLFMEKEVSLLDVLSGQDLKIDTISGEQIEVNIPANSNLNQEIKVVGAGMPHLGRRKRGDLYIKLNAKTPKKISSKAKKLIDDLRAELN